MRRDSGLSEDQRRLLAWIGRRTVAIDRVAAGMATRYDDCSEHDDWAIVVDALVESGHLVRSGKKAKRA